MTASHVFDQRDEFRLTLPYLELDVSSLVAIRTDPRGFDVTALLLPRSTAVDESKVRVVETEDLDVDDRGERRFIYCFAGFPHSKNKSRPGGRYNPRLFVHSTRSAIDSSYTTLKRDPRTFLALSFARERTVDRSFSATMFPEPSGMSGGPVWRLGSGDDILGGRAQEKLVAIAIECHARACVVLTTRVSVLIHILRSEVPELRSVLPRPSFLTGRVRVTSGA